MNSIKITIYDIKAGILGYSIADVVYIFVFIKSL